jgi:RNA polymerase sigma factor (sigma-70 family)
MTGAPRAGDLLRELAPQVLGALVRRHGDFGRCEDALQEALVAAHATWPAGGVPDAPRAWLVTVATRRLVDSVRADAARERREAAVSQELRLFAPAADGEPAEHDDSLALLVLCCHPALTPASQLALTLRAVGGLTTAEIAQALLLPEATVTRRITRAKTAVRDAGARFPLPTGDELRTRLDVVHQVLYLMATEGHAPATGSRVHRPRLGAEALRLARLLHRRLPSSSETTGLLALLLLPADPSRPAGVDAPQRSGASGTVRRSEGEAEHDQVLAGGPVVADPGLLVVAEGGVELPRAGVLVGARGLDEHQPLTGPADLRLGVAHQRPTETAALGRGIDADHREVDDPVRHLDRTPVRHAEHAPVVEDDEPVPVVLRRGQEVREQLRDEGGLLGGEHAGGDDHPCDGGGVLERGGADHGGSWVRSGLVSTVIVVPRSTIHFVVLDRTANGGA